MTSSAYVILTLPLGHVVSSLDSLLVVISHERALLLHGRADSFFRCTLLGWGDVEEILVLGLEGFQFRDDLRADFDFARDSLLLYGARILLANRSKVGVRCSVEVEDKRSDSGRLEVVRHEEHHRDSPARRRFLRRILDRTVHKFSDAFLHRSEFVFVDGHVSEALLSIAVRNTLENAVTGLRGVVESGEGLVEDGELTFNRGTVLHFFGFDPFHHLFFEDVSRDTFQGGDSVWGSELRVLVSVHDNAIELLSVSVS